MIEKLCILIINELGPTGLLVLGLYLILYGPLKSIAQHLETINHELGTIVMLLQDEKKWQK